MSTPHTSQTKAERPLLYLGVAIATAAAILLVTAALSFFVNWRTEWTQDGALIAFEAVKLERHEPIDTVFIGDSSLGNAIDVRAFDKADGTHSVNLAATGHLGLGTTYNMLRRAVAKHPGVRNVVVMQFATILAEPSPFRGFVLSAPNDDLSGIAPSAHNAIRKAFFQQLVDWQSYWTVLQHVRGERVLLYENDFVKQGMPKKNIVPVTTFVSQRNPEHDVFIAAIARLCREKHLNCMFAFGPYAKGSIETSRAFLDASAAHIAQLGLPVAVGHPMPIPPSEQGDTLNHVAPPFKQKATAYYAQMLRERLATSH